MLALRFLLSEGRHADRRAPLAVAAVLLSFGVLLALIAGVGAWAVWTAGALVLGALPWVFVSFGRPYLPDDAMAGIAFAWRGERAGAWATAPPAGFLLAVTLADTLGLGTAVAVLAGCAGAVGHPWLVAWVERRHERATMLELTVLEQRFERITDARPPAPRPPAPAPTPAAQATQEWVPDFAEAPRS
jgi:hypothetical protein